MEISSSSQKAKYYEQAGGRLCSGFICLRTGPVCVFTIWESVECLNKCQLLSALWRGSDSPLRARLKTSHDRNKQQEYCILQRNLATHRNAFSETKTPRL
jgi:hypothetical protein